VSILFGARRRDRKRSVEQAMQFFRHRRRAADRTSPSAGPPDERGAFAAGIREGRREERARREPRLRRKGHPMIGLLVALLVVAGAAMLALAVHEGSFQSGGRVVDENISNAVTPAQTAGADAIVRTGRAIENAGDALQPKAGDPSSAQPDSSGAAK
jgi:hypothetical protein